VTYLQVYTSLDFQTFTWIQLYDLICMIYIIYVVGYKVHIGSSLFYLGTKYIMKLGMISWSDNIIVCLFIIIIILMA